MYAAAYASGLIVFERRCPKGALPLARGRARKLRPFIEVHARHGWSPGVLLWPIVGKGETAMKAKKGFKMKAKEGFDWSLVKWTGPDDVVSDTCSYCSAPIPENDIPLRMWAEDHSACVFCDDCSRDVFGLLTFDEPDEGASP